VARHIFAERFYSGGAAKMALMAEETLIRTRGLKAPQTSRVRIVPGRAPGDAEIGCRCS
jgi:hypothetical protein